VGSSSGTTIKYMRLLQKNGVGLRRPCRGQAFCRYTAEQSNCYRFCLCIRKVALAAMYLRRDRVVGHSFLAALAHVSTVVTPPAPAAQNLAVVFQRPCRGQAFDGVLGAMVRFACAQPVTSPNSPTKTYARDLGCFYNFYLFKPNGSRLNEV